MVLMVTEMVSNRSFFFPLLPFLHASPQNSKDLENSSNSCDPYARKAIGGGGTKSCPIRLLCVHFKILERLIYARVDAIIDPLLHREQACFRHRRSIIDQVSLLTEDIEGSFSAKKRAGAVSVDLISLRHCMAPWPHLQATAIAA